MSSRPCLKRLLGSLCNCRALSIWLATNPHGFIGHSTVANHLPFAPPNVWEILNSIEVGNIIGPSERWWIASREKLYRGCYKHGHKHLKQNLLIHESCVDWWNVVNTWIVQLKPIHWIRVTGQKVHKFLMNFIVQITNSTRRWTSFLCHDFSVVSSTWMGKLVNWIMFLTTLKTKRLNIIFCRSSPDDDSQYSMTRILRQFKQSSTAIM